MSKLIIEQAVSYLKERNEDLGQIDRGYNNNLSFISAINSEKIDVILSGTYVANDNGLIQYDTLKNSLTSFKGINSTVLARKQLRQYEILEELDFDVSIFKDHRENLAYFTFYPSDTMAEITDVIRKETDMILNKIVSKESCIIKGVGNDKNNKIIVEEQTRFRVLFTKGSQLRAILDFDKDYFSEEDVIGEVENKVRTEEYKLWRDLKVTYLNEVDAINMCLLGNETIGGGFGEIHSFWKFNFGMEKI